MRARFIDGGAVFLPFSLLSPVPFFLVPYFLFPCNWTTSVKVLFVLRASWNWETMHFEEAAFRNVVGGGSGMREQRDRYCQELASSVEFGRHSVVTCRAPELIVVLARARISERELLVRTWYHLVCPFAKHKEREGPHTHTHTHTHL